MVATVAALTVLAASGCGSESAASEPGPVPVDLSKLDTGNYNTKPQVLAANDAGVMARQLEALRLADVLPLPKEIDPALTFFADVGGPFTSVRSFDDEAIFGWLNATEFDANTAGLVGGFHTSAQTHADRSIATALTNSVMIFDSESSAAAAAGALARSGFNKPEGSEPAASSTFPTAHITWKPESQALASWYAVGRYVINTFVYNSENSQIDVSDQPLLLNLVDKAIAVTVERLKKFQPTPPDKLSELPFDPTGMMRITLLRPKGDNLAAAFEGVLSAAGSLHRSTEVDQDRALLDSAGVDLISYGAVKLYRTRDPVAANKLVQDMWADRFSHRIDPPPGLPTAVCTRYKGPNIFTIPFSCYIANGRFVAMTWSKQQQDAYQRISAQYAMLANDK
ncbi:hypothetical protein ABZ319_10540 [Nocardia sp. NPDC005978]|uniref:DUF7373 family lipoprotein n=1 Tax=Nocardia sp. NPDC005978 TaxID=3156725 RepID=UPI0033A2F821